MRKLLVKHFVLDYFITVFGKQFRAVRASRVIMPIVILCGILNILNPTLVFSFSAMFLAFGMGPSIGNPRDIGTFIIGFITGTIVFWYGFGMLIMYMKTRDQSHRMHTINKGFGVVLLAVGIILLLLATIHIVFPGYVK